MLEALLHLDSALFVFLNSTTLGPLGDGFFAAVTTLGSGWVLGPIALTLGMARFRSRWRRVVATLLTTLLVGGAFTVCLKFSVDRPRPPAAAGVNACSELTTAAPGQLPLQLRTPVLCRHSFPSGHTQTAFGLFLVLALMLGRRWLAPALAVALLVGASRIYLGVHYPLDVAFGALIGTASALVAHATVWLPGPADPAQLSS